MARLRRRYYIDKRVLHTERNYSFPLHNSLDLTNYIEEVGGSGGTVNLPTFRNGLTRNYTNNEVIWGGRLDRTTIVEGANNYSIGFQNLDTFAVTGEDITFELEDELRIIADKILSNTAEGTLFETQYDYSPAGGGVGGVTESIGIGTRDFLSLSSINDYKLSWIDPATDRSFSTLEFKALSSNINSTGYDVYLGSKAIAGEFTLNFPAIHLTNKTLVNTGDAPILLAQGSFLKSQVDTSQLVESYSGYCVNTTFTTNNTISQIGTTYNNIYSILYSETGKYSIITGLKSSESTSISRLYGETIFENNFERGISIYTYPNGGTISNEKMYTFSDPVYSKERLIGKVMQFGPEISHFSRTDYRNNGNDLLTLTKNKGFFRDSYIYLKSEVKDVIRDDNKFYISIDEFEEDIVITDVIVYYYYPNDTNMNCTISVINSMYGNAFIIHQDTFQLMAVPTTVNDQQGWRKYNINVPRAPSVAGLATLPSEIFVARGSYGMSSVAPNVVKTGDMLTIFVGNSEIGNSVKMKVVLKALPIKSFL